MSDAPALHSVWREGRRNGAKSTVFVVVSEPMMTTVSPPGKPWPFVWCRSIDNRRKEFPWGYGEPRRHPIPVNVDVLGQYEAMHVRLILEDEGAIAP
jgi:hypothetical protein